MPTSVHPHSNPTMLAEDILNMEGCIISIVESNIQDKQECR